MSDGEAMSSHQQWFHKMMAGQQALAERHRQAAEKVGARNPKQEKSHARKFIAAYFQKNQIGVVTRENVYKLYLQWASDTSIVPYGEEELFSEINNLKTVFVCEYVVEGIFCKPLGEDGRQIKPKAGRPKAIECSPEFQRKVNVLSAMYKRCFKSATNAEIIKIIEVDGTGELLDRIIAKKPIAEKLFHAVMADEAVMAESLSASHDTMVAHINRVFNAMRKR